ncbi:MAG: hypothetical protein ABIF04_08375 [Chloroflexota bacterium]
MSKQINFKLLGVSFGAFLFANLFRRRTPQDSGRFRTVRRVGEYNRRRREEREQEEAEREE